MEQIKREKPAYKSLLGFYEKIYIEKEWCHQSLAPVCSSPDEEYIRLCIEKGFPILDKSAIHIKYLYVENEKQYRIEVCKACGKYLTPINGISAFTKFFSC